jgi:hypothetical protein
MYNQAARIAEKIGDKETAGKVDTIFQGDAWDEEE